MRTLKNGVQEHEAIIEVVTDHIRILFRKNRAAFLQLVRLCRGTDCPVNRSNEHVEYLLGLNLLVLEAGNTVVVHDSVKAIVLSAVEGDEDNIRIVSPYRE